MKKRKVSKNRAREVKAYDFLSAQASTSQTFTLTDLATAVGWKGATPKTYVTKHWADLVERAGKDTYRVKPEFTRLTEEQFLAHGTQVRQVYTAYRRRKHEHVLQYEFLLPLTREDQLRRALDDLFYADTIQQRLREVGLEQFHDLFLRTPNESDDDFTARMLAFVENKISGYSISHVSGRFRASSLKTRTEAGGLLVHGTPYLMDETTALVRFIIPCAHEVLEYDDDLGSIEAALARDGDPHSDPGAAALAREVRQVRLLFYHLFVEAVARTVGEQEIWLLERGPYGQKLYVWSRS